MRRKRGREGGREGGTYLARIPDVLHVKVDHEHLGACFSPAQFHRWPKLPLGEPLPEDLHQRLVLPEVHEGRDPEDPRPRKVSRFPTLLPWRQVKLGRLGRVRRRELDLQWSRARGIPTTRLCGHIGHSLLSSRVFSRGHVGVEICAWVPRVFSRAAIEHLVPTAAAFDLSRDLGSSRTLASGLHSVLAFASSSSLASSSSPARSVRRSVDDVRLP